METEELITLAQGDGGPLHAKSNKGYGLFYLRGEKRMLAMDSKVRAPLSNPDEFPPLGEEQDGNTFDPYDLGVL